ncbi:AraC family transcriptional regulator [Lentilactobacillus buchneri subsp. silagei]|uniref:helix-turn-helix domain-containing protein n=1 Tax=Lentilactobacillus buchneri TaxID=1581 RepID=UPI0012E570A8|nr:AraC family transcriptional regulator [Lentilactobacillus buchneri]GED93417.1 AraC family transcriptional regulator [Lentilactobacillus buchneri subsp. silagei]
MNKKVYKFSLYKPAQFFKAGQYFANQGWRHKDIVNDGDYELFIMLSGAAYIQIGTEKFALTKHDCLLIPPHIRHVGYQDSPDNTVYYWMHFFPGGTVTTSFDSSLPITKVETKIPQLFTVSSFERLVILIRQLLDSANDPNVPKISSNYFISSILIELSHQYTSAIQDSHKSSTRFELIKNWIRIHSHEKLSVNKIAAEFQMTPIYLTRLFKTYEDTTTIHFINSVKIKQAQELLLTTDKSIKEIAYDLSFSNEKYFLRIFKQVTSLTPSNFRNSYSKTYLNNLEVDPTIPKP